LKWNGFELELDVYQGSFDGLVVAEVGVESAEDSKRFSQPTWFGEEVTEDQHYKNSSLALKGRFLPSSYRWMIVA
jgi:adenylate cyclase